MIDLRGKAAIIGIGEVPTGIYPDRPCLASALESCRQAIRDSGLSKSDIEVVIPTGTFFDGWYNTNLIFSKLIEELGLQSTAKLNFQAVAGGASSAAMLTAAVGMVTAGVAKAVLCVHSEKWGSAPLQEIIDKLASFGVSEEFEAPYGLNYNAIAGLVTQRYMNETGTTAEQLASVCVSMRKWSQLNPNAMLRNPLTVEDVLGSKMVSYPLHSRECNVLADGGSAFVVTSAEIAKEATSTPVYVLGLGSAVTHYSLSQEADLTRFGWSKAGKEAFDMAGLTPKDVDIAELYDSYPVFVLIMLEELGLCERGEAGRFVLEGHTWPGGSLPMTTNGGMLAQGHTGTGGGVAVLVEAARQLMGKAGERQVEGARIAVETAVGGTYMDSHVSILGRELV